MGRLNSTWGLLHGRLGHLALTILLILTTLSGALGGGHVSAMAGPAAHVAATINALYPGLATTPAPGENELAGMTTELVTTDGDAGATMRQRPFIVGEQAIAATLTEQMSGNVSRDLDKEDGARAALVAFLTLRGVDSATIDGAVSRFDDRGVKVIVPAPRLRAALLMLSGWNPYQSTIAAILDGKNPTGKPFTSLDFDSTSLDNAIAETYEDPSTGLDSIVVGSGNKNEPPQTLIPALVHESLHGGGHNSAEEEIIANIMDTICWGELLLIQPEMAEWGTPLTVNNNFKLVALLNSIGRAGPEEIGVATSPNGDVLIGIGLQAADTESIRAMIEQIWLYDALRNIGSDGQATTAAMLSRIPGGKALGKNPRYDETTIALIDAGIDKIITQQKAVKLAATLKLEKTTKYIEVSAKGKIAETYAETVGQRPFVATDPKVFSYGKAATTLKPYSEKRARSMLKTWYQERDADATLTADVLAKYDSDAVKAQIPDPALRAAALMLYQWQPWDLAYGVIFDGKNPDRVPLRIQYVPMRDSAPVQRQSDLKHDGTPAAILVNSLLLGESPELLASVLVEGTLLHDATLLKEEAISAATVGTLAWADIIDLEPGAATERTWGVLQRNLYLLAMLNSKSLHGDIGILRAPNAEQDVDVLLGVYPDAPTFAKMVDNTPWGVRFDRSTQLVAPDIFVQLVQNAGITLHRTTDGLIAYGDATLADLDSAIGFYLPPDKIMTVAKALDVRTVAVASA